jgi:predicted permease
MLSDLKFAFRQFAKTPGFTVIAVLTLAIGIGSVATMFSALRALVLNPFDYPRPDEIVQVWSNNGQPLSGPDFADMQARTTVFAEFGTYSPQTVNLGGENPQSLRGIYGTPGVLRTFGINPLRGRLLTEADDKDGAPVVAVISYALWQNVWGGDPGVIGRTVRLDGAPATIVGIMPADFEFFSPWMRTEAAQIWLPLQLKPDPNARGNHWLCTLGRLKPGVTVAAAEAEVKSVARQLAAEYPATNAQKPFLVRSLHEEATRNLRSRVWLLFGAVTLVLFVACANVASMLLARSARRQGELGVRIALGASRSQVVRLALVESLLLALSGSVIGLTFALFGVELVAAITPVSAARRAAITLDGGVVAFSIGVTFLTALLAGLPPALGSMRLTVTDLLRADSRSTTGSRLRHNSLRLLITAQVAIAFILANGAALFSTSYVRLLAANESLSTENVVTLQLQLEGERYDSTEKCVQFWRQLAERAAALPGVTAAGVTSKLPLEGGNNMGILVNTETFDPHANRGFAEISAVTPGYFAAAGITLLQGRILEPADAQGAITGIVVNRAMVEKYWPGQNPLGQLVRANSSDPADFQGRIVGVVEDVRQWGPETPANPEIYWPPEKAWGHRIFLVARSDRPASGLVSSLRQEIARLDPDLPVAQVRTFKQLVTGATRGQRAVMGMVNFFMAAALGLVAVGLYGTLSYHVLQRTREIGVRIAMGAGRRDILWMVFHQGSGWVVGGLLLGLAGSLALTKLMQSLVYGMESVDPLALVLATAVIGLATLLACWLPALRATKVNPLEALRTE